MHDTIIIGSGPAGLQAALFLTRAGIKTLVIGDADKSDLSYGRKIGNLFGQLGDQPGKVLLANSLAAIKTFGGELMKDEVVDARQSADGSFSVKTQGGQFMAKTLVLATGVAHVKAGIVNEEKFLGRGIHTCVACDGPFFKGKKVAVVGEGNFAAEEALELMAHTSDVTIYSQAREWELGAETKSRLEEKKINLSNGRIIKVDGEKMVQSADLEDGSKLKLDGVFVALGSASSVAFAQKLGLEMKDGFIVIGRDGKTNLDGVYAAGGCTGGNQQIAKSVGEGCNAAISIIKKLRGVAEYFDQT